MADGEAASRSIVLLRHTPLRGADGVCYGRSELALADSAAADVARVLATLPAFDRVVSSPALRCRGLALAAHAATQTAGDGSPRDPGSRDPPVWDARWLELDFGRWEGLPWDAVPRTELDAWAADTWNYAPGGGECARELYARVGDALDSLRSVPHAGRTLVVTHAGPLRAASVLLRGLRFADHFAIPAEPGAWVELPL